jgi:hypothetical protein
MFILKNLNIEAKRTGSIVILYFKKRKKSELSFFLKTKGKKRKGSLVNYRSFAITSPDHSLNMELDLQSLFGLLCTAVTHWVRPCNSTPPPSPHIWAHIYGAICQPRYCRLHLFVTPWSWPLEIYRPLVHCTVYF